MFLGSLLVTIVLSGQQKRSARPLDPLGSFQGTSLGLDIALWLGRCPYKVDFEVSTLGPLTLGEPFTPI